MDHSVAMEQLVITARDYADRARFSRVAKMVSASLLIALATGAEIDATPEQAIAYLNQTDLMVGRQAPQAERDALQLVLSVAKNLLRGTEPVEAGVSVALLVMEKLTRPLTLAA